MNCNLSIPDDTIEKFKCSTCNNTLSYFPISLTEDNKNVCGRCVPDGKLSIHNKVFEEIVQHIKFPCRYKEQGCHELLLPKLVPSHEENCNFKIVKCPKVKSVICSWQGACMNMLSHCRYSHRDMFLKDNTFKLDLNALLFLENYLEHDGTLFVVSIGFNFVSQSLSFVIHHVEDDTNSENYPFQVILNRDRKRVMVESVTTSFSDQKLCEVALDSLTKNNNDLTSLVTGYITFERSIDGDVPRKRFKQDLLTLLKCPKCDAYMLPPIDRTENKTKCPGCSSLNELKLFDVDGLAETLEYPCRYEKNGCEVVLKSEKMKKHVPICPFANDNCVFCDWKGFAMEVTDHVVQAHADTMIENGQIISVENKCDSLKRVLCYCNRLFLLMFRIGQFPGSNKLYYKWVVVSLSKGEEFRYRIDFVNVRNKSSTSMIRTCLALSEYLQGNKEAHACGSDSTFFHLQDLERVTFKVCILK